MHSKLRAALATFERSELAWVADGFAAERYVSDPSALENLVSEVEKAQAGDLDAVLRVGGGKGPFECFALACLARHAGIGKDLIIDGIATELPAAIAGNLVVRGPLVCTIENWLLVAGDVQADMLLASADVIVGGNVRVRDGVLGVNNWCQSMWIHGSLETPCVVVSDYAAEFGDGPEPVELSDDAASEALAEGFSDELRKWSEDGPDETIAQLLQRVERGQPLFRKT
ncbi:MAG: hypothetical protein IPG50_17555 [Myxococcales bacterium]|nr:hypothetical protein [Myxococcales bacterium]